MKATLPSPAQLEERLPIWEALSEFFLDTNLQPADHERIARRLAASKYSEQELSAILAHEVYPVCGSNTLSIAGEWAGFDAAWLKAQIAPRYDRRPQSWFSRLPFWQGWIYRRNWNKVRARVAELRANVTGGK